MPCNFKNILKTFSASTPPPPSPAKKKCKNVQPQLKNETFLYKKEFTLAFPAFRGRYVAMFQCPKKGVKFYICSSTFRASMDVSAKTIFRARLSFPLALWTFIIAADQFPLRPQAPVNSEAISMAVLLMTYSLH